MTRARSGIAFASLPDMALREFVDSSGKAWRVWFTLPMRGAVVAGTVENGWLTFEAKDCRRRLAPPPVDWEVASPQRLEQMCRAATDSRERVYGSRSDVPPLRDGRPDGRA